MIAILAAILIPAVGNVYTLPLNLPDKEFSVDKVGIGRDVATLPEVFKANGYFTAIPMAHQPHTDTDGNHISAPDQTLF